MKVMDKNQKSSYFAAEEEKSMEIQKMATEYIEIDLTQAQKMAVLKYAGVCVFGGVISQDLKDKRKKWIRFEPFNITDVIGELTYHLNRSNDDATIDFLDELICHLEYYEKG